jgi:adenylate kinase family enzyme
MQRVSVVGNSGSGKTTLARELAQRLGVPHVELDAINHQPDWQELPTDEFRARVAETASGRGWVIDGNYASKVRDIVWARADTVVWLDPPRRVVMRRIIRRTLGRVVLRRELWNGNREQWRFIFTLDPQYSVIAWAWTQHDTYHRRYEEATADPAWSHLRFVRLRSNHDSRALLRETAPESRHSS